MELKKSISKILTLIICLVPFLITPGFSDTFYLVKAIFIIIITLLIVIKWTIYEKNIKSKILNDGNIIKLALIYLMLIYISTIFSVDISNSLLGASNRWESVIILSCYILLFFISSKYFDFSVKHIKIFIYSGSLMSLIGLLQFFRIIYYENYAFAWGKFTAAYGTLGNPNYLGAYITLILPFSIYFYILNKRFVYYFSSCLLYSVLILTMTRGAWLGSSLALVLMFGYYFRDKTNRKRITSLFFAFIVITIGFDLLLNGAIILRFLSIIFEFGGFVSIEGPDEMAGSSRIFTWTRILHSIPLKPFFGVGVSNLRYIFETYYHSDIVALKNVDYVVLDRAHNEFLHIPMTTGIPSLISYIAFLASIHIEMIINLKKDPIMIAFFASIAGYTVQSVFSSSIISHSYIFWIMLGACIYRVNLIKLRNKITKYE